ncbi:MAG: hypothetical protein R3C26_24355 [Calditrichia bacterium]
MVYKQAAMAAPEPAAVNMRRRESDNPENRAQFTGNTAAQLGNRPGPTVPPEPIFIAGARK